MFARWLAPLALLCALLLQGLMPASVAFAPEGYSIGCISGAADAPADQPHARGCEQCVLACCAALMPILAAAASLDIAHHDAPPLPVAQDRDFVVRAGRKPPSHAPPRFS